MLFLGLLIYLMLFPIANWLLVPFLPFVKSLPLFIWAPVLFILSLFLGMAIAYMIDIYNPDRKPGFRNLIRLKGVRLLVFFSVLAVLGFVVLKLIIHVEFPGAVVLGVIMPIAFVSLVNAIGIEIPLRRLDEVPEPGKVVLPETVRLEVKEEIVRNFTWNFDDKPYSITLVIRRSIYESLKGKERVLDYSRWSDEYVKEGIGGETHELARQMYKIGMPYGTYEEVSFVLSFVQQVITYQKEEEEYPRYPVETLVDSCGDCEDFSILGAAILKCMGYEVALMFLPGHAALGVAGAEGLKGAFITHEGLNYYYCEMTGTGWKFGERPEDYKEGDMKVSPVPALPGKIVRMEDGTSNNS
jgi:hypothetical protein